MAARRHKLLYAMQVRLQEMVRNGEDTRALQAELVYAMDHRGALKMREEERIRSTYDLQPRKPPVKVQSGTDSSVTAPDAVSPPMVVKKEPRGEELWYVRFCVNCEGQLKYSEALRRWFCEACAIPNSSLKAKDETVYEASNMSNFRP